MREAALLHFNRPGGTLQLLQLPKPHPLRKWVDGLQSLLEALEQDSGLMHLWTVGANSWKLIQMKSFALFWHPYPDKALIDNRTYRTSRTGWDPELDLEQNWLLEHARFPSGQHHPRYSGTSIWDLSCKVHPFLRLTKVQQQQLLYFSGNTQAKLLTTVCCELGVRVLVVLYCVRKRKIAKTGGRL